MFPTQTIYLATADVSLFYGIFNGVAMICKQTGMIWGFSFVVAMWMIVKTVMSTTTSAASASGAGAVLSKGVVNMVMPFIFAMLLTTPGLKTTVQVESFSNGKVTKIDNVPFVISVIPASASLLSQEVGTAVETAFAPVGAEYSAISSGANGFINPLKVLMTSRSAIMKLGSIDSQVRSVVSTCLGYDSGTDYAMVIDQVTNAGNTGATDAQTIAIAGVSKTALGALLFQAAQNQTGLVPDVVTDSQTLLSCADAANAVAANIGAKLYTAEFSRAVQGSVNGMDKSTIGQDYSLDGVIHKMVATRNANTGLAGLDATTTGEAQVKTETLNLLFFELVKTQLDCLKSDSSSKTTCQALAIQAIETERANMQNAAQVVPMLQYAGQFANFMMALVIGMSPIIIMFMMFAGVDISKNVNAAVHVIVWPMLVMNVGAEIVNGMTYITVASFMQSIAQGGFITQLLANEIYKEFSVQIGVASQIMASLPVIMSMIFVMGESAAMVSIAKGIEPTAAGTAASTTSTVSSNAPLNSSSSVANTSFSVGGSHRLQTNGAWAQVNSNAQLGSLAAETSKSLTDASVKQETITQGTNELANLQEMVKKGDLSTLGFNSSESKSIRENYEKALRANEAKSHLKTVDAVSSNANTASAGLSGSAGVSAGLSGGGGGGGGGGAGAGGGKSGPNASASAGGGKSGPNASASAGVATGANATDTLNAGDKSSSSETIDKSKAMTEALALERANQVTRGRSNEKSHAVEKVLGSQKNFQTALSSTKSSTDAHTELMKLGSSLVSHSAQITGDQFMHQSETNAGFQRFNLVEGREAEKNPKVRSEMANVQNQIGSGALDRFGGSEAAQQAALRHSAMIRIANSNDASFDDKKMALGYLAKEAAAITGINMPKPQDRSGPKFDLGTPKNETGVDGSALEKKIGADLVHPAVVPTPKPKRSGKGRKVAPAHTTPAQPVGDDLKQQVLKGLETTGNTVEEEVARGTRSANAAGLGDSGSGVVVRTADTVYKNVKSMLPFAKSENNTRKGD